MEKILTILTCAELATRVISTNVLSMSNFESLYEQEPKRISVTISKQQRVPMEGRYISSKPPVEMTLPGKWREIFNSYVFGAEYK